MQHYTVKYNEPDRDEMFLGIYETDTSGIGIVGNLGYRYQPMQKGVLFRFGLSIDSSPILNYEPGGAFGLSIGYIF